MADEEELFTRGLTLLAENPPNLIKALSLLKKARDLFEYNEKVKEFNSAVDKIHFIYSTLSRRELEKAEENYKKGDYKNAIINALESYRFIVKSEPEKLDKETKKPKNLIEDAVIKFLSNIEIKIQQNGYSNESMNEINFVEKIVLDVFFPFIKERAENKTIPNDFLDRIKDKKKIQIALINVYEMLGESAKNKASKNINEGNIKQAEELIEIAREVFEISGFPNKIEELEPLYYRIFEFKGDTEFKAGIEFSKNKRLEKARNHLKNARAYYKKANLKKKKELSEENYLNISLEIGNNILKDGEKAKELGDLISSVSYYDEAYEFFRKINHKKSMVKADDLRKNIYLELAEREYDAAEKFGDENDVDNIELEKKGISLHLPSSIALQTEIMNKKLNHYKDAAFYYQKTDKRSKIKRTEDKIEKITDTLADIFLKQAKKDVKEHRFETAYINYEKAKFYYKTLRKENKLLEIDKKLDNVYSKLNREKLENLQKLIAEKEHILTLQPQGSNKKTSNIEKSGLLIDEKQNKQFLCKSCGKWVSHAFYDSIQEKCINCRDKIRCDECGTEIYENEIFLECMECHHKFCLDCAEKVYDFTQKKCASCREAIKCAVCEKSTDLNHQLYFCTKCSKYYCSSHWDHNQDVCINCRESKKCTKCGLEIYGDGVFICSVCNQPFCIEHYDNNRKVCLEHKEEIICAKCGTSVSKHEIAYKCNRCGFMYCKEHYNTFHRKCDICLKELSPNGKLECNICNKDLTETRFFICSDCKQIFCKDHYNLTKNKCKKCLEKPQIDEKVIQLDIQQSNLSILDSQMPNNSSISNQEKYTLEYNTLRPIVKKYNEKKLLEPEEIRFIYEHQINLPDNQENYFNIGQTDDQMIILRDKIEKPYVAIVPEVPIDIDCKYYGDLIKKLVNYIPHVPKTINIISSIMNLIFFATHNEERWNRIYEILRQSLLKPGLEIIEVLKSFLKGESISSKKEHIINSPFQQVFSGHDILTAIKFVTTKEMEEEVGTFADNEKLNRLLNVFYNLHKGDVLKASEILSILEL